VTQNSSPELRLVVQRLARRLRAMQADSDVTEGQRSVLFVLNNHGAQTLGSLSEHEKVTPPSMNRTINALVASGLVTREADERDARKVTLDLSPSGRAFVKETRRRRDAWITKRLAALTPEQRQILEQATPILQELADN
jgi:DNA-binding MarR family transcriptional regulator